MVKNNSSMQSIKKILIVDDDIHARQLVQKVLKKMDFIEFLEAETGEEAIAIARDKHPDIILMDILMSGMNGYEACRQIKKNDVSPSSIVIFMTAVSMEEIDDQIIQVQGDDLLRKPLDASELYFRVKNYLSLSKLQSHSDVGILREHINEREIERSCNEEHAVDLGQGFFYQHNMKCLCKDQQLIPLMKQEILLLEMLIRYKNRMLSYDELVGAISQESMSSVGNVRTLVKLLRNKTYNDLIKNLNSYGYQLVV